MKFNKLIILLTLALALLLSGISLRYVQAKISSKSQYLPDNNKRGENKSKVVEEGNKNETPTPTPTLVPAKPPKKPPRARRGREIPRRDRSDRIRKSRRDQDKRNKVEDKKTDDKDDKNTEEEPKVPAKGKIIIEFQEGNIKELIKEFSEILGKNFTYEDTIKGNITLIGPKEVTKWEARKIFEASLERMGYIVVWGWPINKIVPISKAKGHGNIPVID